MLLIALSTVFLCSADKGYFYRLGNDNWNTAKTLAIAENLSPDHNFRLFLKRRQGSDGAPAYYMYSRFPVGGYALVKLAILPFGNDLSARILAARMLMLLLFAAAALLAFHSLARLTSHRWVALAATLTAFSSFYMLFYANAVSNEFSMELFAVMLVFHGMVVFVQEGRFRQLLARTGVALLLGWRVYAFLAPFLILGTACEAVRAWKDGTALWPRLRSTGAAVLRSRYLALGVFALLFGAAVLGFNFANEYAAFGGETRVAELPSVRSMLRRTGLDPDFEVRRQAGWLHFLGQQLFRVCASFVPFVLADPGVELSERFPALRSLAPSSVSGWAWSVSLPVLLAAMAASTIVVCLARPLLARRHHMLLATLALSGFCWALPMNHNTSERTHDFEGLFYVGVPLVFYSLLLLYVHKRWGRRPVVGLAVAALLAFVVSASQMDRQRRPDAGTAEFQRAALTELGTIRETTRGKVVLVLPSVEPEWFSQFTEGTYVWIYYLAGSVLTHSHDMEAAARTADFIVTRNRMESGALLTPGNERMFLYDSAGVDDLVEFYRATYQRVASGEPAARSHFDVYLGNGALFHVKDPCVRNYEGYRVFVEVFPEDPEDLPRWRRLGGLELFIPFDINGVLFEEKCMVILSLPDHPISGIRTGQAPSPRLSREGRHAWEVEIPASR